MHLLQIKTIIETSPVKEMSNYSVYAWKVEGWIDGEYVAKVKLDTLSGKEAKYVQALWEGQVEEDTKFPGYKIPTPAKEAAPQGEGQGLQPVQGAAPPSNAPPPPPQHGAPPARPAPTQPARAAAPQPSGKAKFMDVVQCYRRCLDAAAYVVGWDISIGIEEGSLDSLHPVAACLFIECNRNGIAIPKAKEKAPSTPEVNSKSAEQFAMEALNTVLQTSGLTQAVIENNIENETLMEWWNAAGGVADAFTARIKHELDEIDRLPF